MSICSIIKKFDNQLTYCNSWNNLDGHSMSVEMALFDRPYVTSWWQPVVSMYLSCIFPRSYHLLWSTYGIGQAIIFWPCVSIFLSSFYLFSSPNLSGRRLDVYHTSTDGVALVRI